ncbi:MAG TPA: hypothetical protein DEP28_00350 [Bacteroidetes bacterium]|nr:hypothetical protein [Ignavibacteria bacterium]HCA41682.1 hypothetical protein [Bacteroidota bacterium]
MKAVEFISVIENNTIKIPDNLLPYNDKKENVKVILLFKDKAINIDEEKFMNDRVKEEFYKGYSEIDNVYDE